MQDSEPDKVSCRANWMAIEPTPPAPPTIRIARVAPGTGLATSSRSNIASQAVIEVSGRAAAGKSSERGFVDEMIFRVRALSADAAGVEHFVAWLEESRLTPGLHHHTGRVVAEGLAHRMKAFEHC